MRALRERPRVVAAKLALAVAALAVAVLFGMAIATDNDDRPPDLRPQLQGSEQVRREQARRLDALQSRIHRLEIEHDAATRRVRIRTRANRQLRRQLRAARRNLAAEQDQ